MTSKPKLRMCEECAFDKLCLYNKYEEECPCKQCVVKAICSVTCIEALEWFNAAWELYDEMMKEYLNGNTL